MFTNGIIIFNQMIVMFFLVAAGYFFYKKEIIDNPTAEKLSLLLSTYIIPATILVSFQRPFEIIFAQELLILFITSLGLFALSILLARKVYPPQKYTNYADRQMCIIFPNNGFLAFPLLEGMFGSLGVFLGSAHLVAMTVVLWTYGVMLMEGPEKKISLKKIIFNPGVLAFICGALIFVSPVKLPNNFYLALEHISRLMTPLAMFVLGSFMAQIKVKSVFYAFSVWQATFFRLVFIPVLTMLLLYFIPLNFTAKIVLLVAVAAPSAVVNPMFAKIYHTDYLFSTRVVILSTLLSLITLPLLITVFTYISSL
ncbi:MAG: hypothetical protein GX357_00550 [Firmicutes bacterium]|nr:hypothetical protein [Bacillota bacterium]